MKLLYNFIVYKESEMNTGCSSLFLYISRAATMK